MRTLINLITGFLYGLTPLIGAGFIAIGVYASLPNTTGILICSILALLGIWAGVIIFKRIQIVGPIEFMSALHASPELDHLEPLPHSTTKRRTAAQLVELINSNKHLLKGGSMRIYGDWFGEPHHNYHVLKSAQYDEGQKILRLQVTAGEVLEIHKPENLFETSTFLKILQAEQIKLSFLKRRSPRNEKTYYLHYIRERKKILTHTNLDRHQHYFDASLGDPALMIFGKG